MMQITVYKRADAFRVVTGTHAPHADSKAYKVTVYADAPLAYTAETDPAIRAAIARIAPEAATLIAPLPPIKKVSLSRAIFEPTKNLPHKNLADAERAATCPGTLQWPRWNGSTYICPDCGRTFTRGELQGRDDHMPAHFRQE